MANIGPGWSINQCFSSRSAALALLATFAAGNIPANWCVIKCQTRPDAAGRPTPPRKSAILCKDFPWAPSLVSDGFSQIDENLTFTAAMAVVTAPEPGFVPGTPPGQCTGSMSFALGGSDDGSSGSGGGSQPGPPGGGGNGGGGREGSREGGGGLPPIIMAPGPQNFEPQPPLNRPRPPGDQPQPPVKKASNDPGPKPPVPGSVAPPPMGQPPQNGPGPTTPQNPPPSANDPGFQSHFLSEPFTPGGQCPNIGAGQYTEKTGFESCKWDDPKKPGGRNGWVGCVAERNANFVCKASNAPQNCNCTQDWSGKVPPLEQLVALAPGPDRAPWQTAMYMDVAPSNENPMGGLGPPPHGGNPGTKTAGLGPPPDPSDNNPMGGLGPPPDPQKQNPPASGGGASAPQGSAAAVPQGPIYIPVPIAPPNVCQPKAPPNVCQPKAPPSANVCQPKPSGSGINAGTNPGTNPGTRIGDTWDTQPKPGDTKTQPAGTAVMNSGTCETKSGVTTCKDTQGRTCTSRTGFCNPAQTTQPAPPPPSGPLKLKQQPGTQVAKLDEPKTAAALPAAIQACESKAPYLPWGGQGAASITVSGGKPCGVGWHDTGATILENINVTSQPAHGTVTPKGKNEVIFTPTPGYKGQDKFMLKMQERNGGRRATLTVRVNVTIR